MDYNEYKVAPEELEFRRAYVDEQRVLRMINERDKAALIFLAVMGAIMGIVAAVILSSLGDGTDKIALYVLMDTLSASVDHVMDALLLFL